jgi:hypothetical protein
MHLARKKTMATVYRNALTRDISGAIGNIVFRQIRGKTIVCNKPDRLSKQSKQQRENRSRFKAATYWAKAQMLDPEKKAYYWRKAKKLKLPNAYTAAVSDYMRKGEIKEIDTKQYKGKAGDVIKLKIRKKDFAVRKVEVMILSGDGNFIESAVAVKKDNDVFIYKATKTIADKGPISIRVLGGDYWNSVSREVVVEL